MRKRVIVIGAGPGGLAAAMLLAGHGYQVDVFEKQPYVGGRNASIMEHAYGVFHPVGGVNQLSKAMAKVVQEHGGAIHLNQGVKLYSYHVASTVGLMLLPILAPKTHRELEADAISLGIAMQITNILRDIGEDLERKRVYLPKDLMNEKGYTIEMLYNQEINPAFISIWEDLAIEAKRFYEEGLQSLHKYPISSQLSLKGAAHLYRAILEKIRKEEYRVFTEKHYVTSLQKQTILTSIL